MFSAEHDSNWARTVQGTAEMFQMSDRLTLLREERPYHECILKAKAESPDILFVDGRDRVLCLSENLPFLKRGGLVVVDNFERASGETGKYRPMNAILAGKDVIHFEQPRELAQSGEMLTLRDRALKRVNHRWLTSIFVDRGTAVTTLGEKL